MINKLRKLNSEIKIYSIYDKEFAKYGKVIDFDTTEIVTEAKKIYLPTEGSLYEPSIESLEKLSCSQNLCMMLTGGLGAQIGMVRGYSNKLNGLEYHKSSEINVAVTPIVLLFGLQYEMNGETYDSSKIEAFYLEEGDIIEVFSTTLHFCPCQVSDSGFGAIVILPKGTNTLLDERTDDKILFKKNKWLICHKDNKSLIDLGVHPGIHGENYQIKY